MMPLNLSNEKMKLFNDYYVYVKLLNVSDGFAEIEMKRVVVMTKPFNKKFKIRNGFINLEGHNISINNDFV